jgi:hypothetical protein
MARSFHFNSDAHPVHPMKPYTKISIAITDGVINKIAVRRSLSRRRMETSSKKEGQDRLILTFLS